jgi:uncharacterized protein (DUF58 family)
VSVIQEVLAELWSMFVGDRRLTLLLLAVVGIAAAAAFVLPAAAVAVFILLGAVLILADSVFHAARKATR